MKVTLKKGQKVGEVVLTDDLTLTLPIVKYGVMGPPNTGKSRLLSTMETPGIIILADPFEKAQCFFDTGFLDEKVYKGNLGQPIRLVYDAPEGVQDRKLLWQIECFLDPNPSIPWGYSALLQRCDQLTLEVQVGKWKSAGFDSWSQIEYIAKIRRTTGPFAGVDSVAAAVKDDCEQLIKSRICTLACNVGVTLHINTKMIDAGGGTMLYEPVATGTLKSGIGSVLGEMYRSDSIVDASVPGGLKYVLQTTRDGRFDCGTRIGAPNGCSNDFKALFSNWIAKKVAMIAAARAPQSAKEEAKS